MGTGPDEDVRLSAPQYWRSRNAGAKTRAERAALSWAFAARSLAALGTGLSWNASKPLLRVRRGEEFETEGLGARAAKADVPDGASAAQRRYPRAVLASPRAQRSTPKRRKFASIKAADD